MITLHGIKNCDTIKKAKAWLKSREIAFDFHDYKTLGITAEILEEWTDQVEWTELLNKRGTTWRKLDDDLKQEVDRFRAIELMVAHPSLIKRPVLVDNNQIIVGFKEAQYESFFD